MSIGSEVNPLNLNWTTRPARKRCKPLAYVFGKPYDSECVDESFVVDVVEEPLDVEP
jgi:hypothetical protein